MNLAKLLCNPVADKPTAGLRGAIALAIGLSAQPGSTGATPSFRLSLSWPVD